MAETTAGLRDVHSAYVGARGWAMGATTVRLRWQTRRLERARDRLDAPALARLRALVDELHARGARPS